MAEASWLDVFSSDPEKKVEGAKKIGAAVERVGNVVNTINPMSGLTAEQVAQQKQDPIFAENLPVVGPPASAATPPQRTVTPAPATPPVQTQQTAPQMATQTETQIATAPKLNAEQKASEERAYVARNEADAAKANLDKDLALAQSMQAQDTQRELAKRQAADAAEAAKIKNEADDAARKWQSSIDEYNTIRKTGPEETNSGGAVLAAIAQALGSLGSGLTGGPNHAMAILNKAADDRVRKWERQLSEARGAIDAKQNAVAWFRQKGLDQRSAAAAAKQAILDDAMIRGDALTSQYKSEQIQALWQQTKAARDQERAAALNQRALEEQDKKVVKILRAPGGGGPSVDAQIRLEGLKVDVPQQDADGNFTGYQTYQARSAADAEKVRQAFVVRDQIRAGVEQMRTFMQNTAVHSVGPNSTEIETMADDLRTQFGVLRGLGALSAADYKIASQLGKPGSPFQLDSTTYKLMDKLTSRLDASVLAELKGRGMLR